MIKVLKLVDSLFFVAVFSKRNGKHVLRVFYRDRVTETLLEGRVVRKPVNVNPGLNVN